MTTHEILKLTRENITDPNRWCHGGTDPIKSCIGQHLMHAAGFYSWGDLNSIPAAIELCSYIKKQHPMIGRLGSLGNIPNYTIPWFNDTHTHAECLALLDAAIEETTPVIRDLPAAIKYIFRPETIAA